MFSGRTGGRSGMASHFHIACHEKFSITSIMYRHTDEEAAKVFAHELGHTLGMR